MNKEIVFISNGPIVLEREMADEIESFDTIVRFNNFTTQGYEECVGQRTDIWSTRICSTINQRNPKDFKEIIGIMNYCRYTSAIRALAPKFVALYPDINIIYAEQVERYSADFGYSRNDNWLSVGMITLLHMLDFYKIVHLYGFGGDTTCHYYPQKPSGDNFHKFDVEAAAINKLVESGKVVRI